MSTRAPVLALVLAMGALVSSCAGCAPYQNVGVESVPKGAQVYLDGDLIGTTPMKTSVGRLVDHSVFLKKEGYRPQLVVLRKNEPPDGLFFLTPADVRVRLSRLEGTGGEADPGSAGGETGADPTQTRELEIEVEE